MSVLVLLLAACDRKAAPIAAQQPNAPVTVAQRTERFTASMAGFDGDQMVSCVDLIFDVVAGDGPLDRATGSNRLAAWVDARAKSSTNGPKTIRIPKLCSHQFSDREPFARCKLESNQESHATLIMSEYFYSFSHVFESDETMKECLEMKGDWNAIARDSQRFREAALDHDLKNARKLVDKASHLAE